MKFTSLLSTGLVFAGLLSLTSTAFASAPTGGGAKVAILIDRGLEGRPQDQQNQLNQVCDYFEPDLLEQFNRAGYLAVKITARDQFQPAPGKYLAVVKIIKYNPGSKAARMLVGFGAGSASLDLRFEVYGEGPQPLLVKDHGRGSSRDWQFVCRTLSKDLVKFMGEALKAK